MHFLHWMDRILGKKLTVNLLSQSSGGRSESCYEGLTVQRDYSRKKGEKDFKSLEAPLCSNPALETRYKTRANCCGEKAYLIRGRNNIQ